VTGRSPVLFWAPIAVIIIVIPVTERITDVLNRRWQCIGS